MPTTATSVSTAASALLLPKRAATRSASEALFCARASAASRNSSGSPNRNRAMVPMKVGVTGLPQRVAWVTVP